MEALELRNILASSGRNVRTKFLRFLVNLTGDHDQSDAAGPSDAGDVHGGGDFGDEVAAAGVDQQEKVDTEEKDDKKEETQIDSADVIMKLDADINETDHEIEAVLNSIRTNRPGGDLRHY